MRTYSRTYLIERVQILTVNFPGATPMRDSNNFQRTTHCVTFKAIALLYRGQRARPRGSKDDVHPHQREQQTVAVQKIEDLSAHVRFTARYRRESSSAPGANGMASSQTGAASRNPEKWPTPNCIYAR